MPTKKTISDAGTKLYDDLFKDPRLFRDAASVGIACNALENLLYVNKTGIAPEATIEAVQVYLNAVSAALDDWLPEEPPLPSALLNDEGEALTDDEGKSYSTT